VSVKVFRVEREAVLDKLKKWAQGLSRDKNVIAVVLFGSFAKGEETPASDIDIVILLRDSQSRFDNRIVKFMPKGVGIGVDIFPYTLDEFNSSLQDGWGVASEVLKKGIILYSIDKDKESLSFHEWFLKFKGL